MTLNTMGVSKSFPATPRRLYKRNTPCRSPRTTSDCFDGSFLHLHFECGWPRATVVQATHGSENSGSRQLESD